MKIKENIEALDIEELFSLMAGKSRIKRKNASVQLHNLVEKDPKKYVKYISHFVDALSRPEAQTRWECLNSLSILCKLNYEKCEDALLEAEECLFDEKSSMLKVSALNFLCTFGSLNKKNSLKVWSLIKEAINCYHGEIEFDDMLRYFNVYCSGKIDSSIKKDLLTIMKDLESSFSGGTKRRLQVIVKNLSK